MSSQGHTRVPIPRAESTPSTVKSLKAKGLRLHDLDKAAKVGLVGIRPAFREILQSFVEDRYDTTDSARFAYARGMEMSLLTFVVPWVICSFIATPIIGAIIARTMGIEDELNRDQTEGEKAPLCEAEGLADDPLSLDPPGAFAPLLAQPQDLEDPSAAAG